MIRINAVYYRLASLSLLVASSVSAMPETAKIKPGKPFGPPATTKKAEPKTEPRSDPQTQVTAVVPLPAGQRLCSIVTPGLELSAILRALSEQSKVNIILLGSDDAKITLAVKERPLDEIIQIIALKANLEYTFKNEQYVLGSKAQLDKMYPPPPVVEPEPVKIDPPKKVMKVYTPDHVLASDMARVLGELFPKEELTIVSGPGSNLPEISGGSESAAPFGGGAGGASGAGTAGAASPSASGSRNLLLYGAQETIDRALLFAHALDLKRQQVAINVTISDVSQDALKELGVEWSWSNIVLTEQPAGNGLSVGTFSRSPFTVTAVLKALDQQGKGKLLASPSVVALDGVAASVLIGQRLLFPILIGYTQNNAPIFDKAEEHVGISMQVTPSVASNGEITLSIYPQVSAVTGFLQVNGASYPQVSTREAKTVVRVRSGEPIVLGGLIQEEEIKNLQEVPGLSKIPILGELFKRRRTSKKASQVIITITPTLIEPADAAAASDAAPLPVKKADAKN